jgi:hypothetical protein
MGEHIDNRKGGNKNHKKGYQEGVDPLLARRSRVTFKNYLRQVEEELAEADLDVAEQEEVDAELDK